jgi:hypothetical protein
MTGRDEAVVDVVLITGAVEAMTPGGIAFAGGATAIGEFFAIIGQDCLDLEGRFSDEPLQKISRI